MTAAEERSHPVRLDLEGPLEIKNWRPLVNWFLAIPQFLVAGVLLSVRQVLQLIAFFAVLFTTRSPGGCSTRS